MFEIPENFEPYTIYRFERLKNEEQEEARLIVFPDGSSTLIGALERIFEGRSTVQTGPLALLMAEGFKFREKGRTILESEFPALPGESRRDTNRRWARAFYE